ncbi:MAG: dTMP kinase [Thaumarchaeota archaeon]|nr:dTMP kinase [Nitrososphaerota archaeon]
MKVPGGYIIAMEGIDAVGKNTHSLLLSKWLRRKGVDTVDMSFPDYDTPIGKEIKSFLSGRRAYPIELQHLLFAANRWEKLEDIRSCLRAGDVIVVNRYTESNLAYGKANGLDATWLASLENGMPKADLVVVLDASPSSLSSRRPGDSKDVYEKSSALQGKAQKAYRELARKRGWSLIDADGPVGDIQASVARAVRDALERDRGTSV